MHELGTDRMLACSNVAPDMIPDAELIVDQLGVLAKLAAASSSMHTRSNSISVSFSK